MKGKRVWRRKPLFFGCERSAEGFIFFFKNLAQNGVVLRPGQLKKIGSKRRRFEARSIKKKLTQPWTKRRRLARLVLKKNEAARARKAQRSCSACPNFRSNNGEGLSSSSWCAYKGSSTSCPRGRQWSPQPNFQSSKGSSDPSCPNVCPPLPLRYSRLILYGKEG